MTSSVPQPVTRPPFTQSPISYDDITIRLANISDEATQLYKLINYSFRGKPIVDGTSQPTNIIYPCIHTSFFHDLTDRITLSQVQGIQQSASNTMLVAVIPPTSKHYNDDINNIMLHDGILVGCLNVTQLLPVAGSPSDIRDLYTTVAGQSFELGLYCVDPTYSGRHIGSLLLRYGEQYGVQQFGCTDCLLFMIASRSELDTMYKRHGYVDVTDGQHLFHAANKSDLLDPTSPMYMRVMRRQFASATLHTVPYNDGATFVIRRARFSDANALAPVVNWAYRGKAGVEQWTTEQQYIETPRILPQGVRDIVHQSLQQPDDIVLFVGVKEFAEPVVQDVLQDSNKRFISPTEQMIGCIKLERVHSHPCSACQSVKAEQCNHVVEVGLYAVDPSETGKRYGKHLLVQGELYGQQQMHCTNSMLFVLACRNEFHGTYTKIGYKDTGERIPFVVPEQTIKPEWRGKLDFAVFNKVF